MYGDNIALLGIIPFLIKSGVEPYFLISSRGGLSEKLDIIRLPYKVVHYPYSSTYVKSWGVIQWIKYIKARINFIAQQNAFRCAKHYVNDIHPDIIHSNCSSTLLGLKLAKSCRIPHVMHIREYMSLDHNKQYFPCKSWFLHQLKYKENYNIAITEDVKNYFGVPRTKVIYDGVFNSQLAPRIDNIRKKQFLFVGRVTETKGVEDAIIAFCKIEQSDYCFYIAGSGEDLYLTKLKNLVYSYHKENQVFFLDYIEDVYSLMKDSMAIIVASRFEAFGFITAEAMYNGCIVIGRNTGGTKSQLDNGVRLSNKQIGLRFMTCTELSEALIRFIDMSHEEMDEIRMNAQKTAISLYDTSVCANHVYDYYREILSNTCI